MAVFDLAEHQFNLYKKENKDILFVFRLFNRYFTVLGVFNLPRSLRYSFSISD